MKHHTLLFDDQCPMCRFQMKLLTWLDWFDRLKMVPLSHPTSHEIAPGIQQADLQEAIHCVAKDGRIHRGARALRFVGMRMPAMLPMALVMWVPGVIQISEVIYAWVSRNRHLLSRWFGCKEACTLMPTRQRDQDQGVTAPGE